MYVFDIETTAIDNWDTLEGLTTIHCISIVDLLTDERNLYVGKEVPKAVEILQNAEGLIGHNIMGFDIPAIQKMYPDFNPTGLIRDTKVMGQLIYTEIKNLDFQLLNKGKLPDEFKKKGLIGTHKLAAYGYRLGEHKGDFEGPWDTYTPEMGEYCVQDTVVNKLLYQKLLTKGFSEQSIQLEHDVRAIISLQEKHGFYFDVKKAQHLYSKLAGRRDQLERKLHETFKPFYVKDKIIKPKKDNKKYFYSDGAEATILKRIDFNPGSRDQIANRLMVIKGWKPRQFTDSGKPKVDEEVMAGLKYPEAKIIAEYLMIDKRIGQLAEGAKAWLKLTGDDHRIHGRVNCNGAVTGRATHFNPNVSQVPALTNKKGKVPFGKECRELWCVPEGKVLVGADLSGIELRCLAHYLSRYDGGEYAHVVLEGDIHTLNQQTLGLPERSMAKTWIYAWLYGAGAAKLGRISGKGKAEGDRQMKAYFRRFPAVKRLIRAVQQKVRRGYVIGLDGRKIYIRSKHAALNSLLQSAGALISKQAMVILHNQLLVEHHLTEHVNQVQWSHDEIQLEVTKGYEGEVGTLCVRSFELAGEAFDMRVPITGEFKVGNNWADTH